jgi:lipopolysaccharide transport system ATP-binding protein
MSIIRLKNVSKRFTLQHDRPRSLQELFLGVLHITRTPSKENYWALCDVSLEVEPGEMLGIIGENGAGKSTLLKLLSRIIEPTSGTIEVSGRIGALLELGTGFHPDLTGRENVYLNGSILGFSRATLHRLFGDIVSFSEMERFIDVPVKHYSSGMMMRLGFSTAIHLQPDILLIDEVLAVGDEAFQQRCLDRINQLKHQGVTIVFVTHELRTVRSMCDRAIWLDDGHIQAEGNVERVIGQYLSQVYAAEGQVVHKAEVDGQDEASWRWGSREAEIVRVQFRDEEGHETRTFKTGQTFIARMHYMAHQQIQQPVFGVALYCADGFHISGPNTGFADYPVEAIQGEGYIDFIISHLPLLKGTYLFSATIYDHAAQHAYDHHHQAYTFRVTQSDAIQERLGTLYIPSHWQLGSVPVLKPDEQHGEPDADEHDRSARTAI